MDLAGSIIEVRKVGGSITQAGTRVAIVAAMAGELKPLVRGWLHERRNGVELWRWKFDEGEWVAACAGAGVDAATRAFAEMERDGPVDAVISAGWAGALSEEMVPGRAFNVSAVIDARTGERFRPGKWLGERWLVTSPRVADARKSNAWPKPTRPPSSTWKPPPSPALPRCAAFLFIASRESATDFKINCPISTDLSRLPAGGFGWGD